MFENVFFYFIGFNTFYKNNFKSDDFLCFFYMFITSTANTILEIKITREINTVIFEFQFIGFSKLQQRITKETPGCY